MKHTQSTSKNIQDELKRNPEYKSGIELAARKLTAKSLEERNRMSRREIEAMIRKTAIANYPHMTTKEIEVIVSLRMVRYDEQLDELRLKKQAKKQRTRRRGD